MFLLGHSVEGNSRKKTEKDGCMSRVGAKESLEQKINKKSMIEKSGLYNLGCHKNWLNRTCGDGFVPNISMFLQRKCGIKDSFSKKFQKDNFCLSLDGGQINLVWYN